MFPVTGGAATTVYGIPSTINVAVVQSIFFSTSPNFSEAKKMEEFGIDRNDPANGILLPNDASSPSKGVDS